MKRLVSIAICGLALGLAFAQDPRGAILGRVTDSSGAVIPAVEVRATNVATGVAAAGQTNESGNYRIPFLTPGTYTVTAELRGFKKIVREGIQVRVSDSLELNLQLEPGVLTEVIEVKEEAPLLNTTNASLGQVVDQRRILELPLAAGNPLELITLTPGVIEPSRFAWKAAWNFRQITADGNSAYSTEFQIDGVSNTFAEANAGRSRYAFAAPAEAQSEFRMETSPYDASVGHTAGALVNVSTKGGTNEYHGETHWFVRNRAFDAPSFFNNRNNTKPSVYQDNRWGASLGGPVQLPKLYDGHNKTFFFYTYEGNRWGVPGTFTGTVPTEAQRQGDFSSFLSLPNSNRYLIYNPFSTTVAPDGRYSRTVFPNNVIPKSMLDKVGTSLVNLYPMPNRPGTVDGGDNFFNPANKAIQDYYVHFARVDHAFSDNHRAFVRLQYDHWTEDKNNVFGNRINGIILNRINRGLALDDVVVLSPSLVMNIRYGLTQQDFLERRVTQGYDLASLGFSENLLRLTDSSRATVPIVRLTNYSWLSTWESGDGVTNSLTHSLALAFTKLHTNHNLKFGTDVRVYRAFADRYPASVAPDFSPPGNYTNGPLDNAPAAPRGTELAALLIGIPGGTMDRSASFAMQDQYYGLYLHDDFKATRKLTISFGLRYELERPVTERFNRLVAAFDGKAVNPIQAQVHANYAANPVPGVAPFPVLGGLTWVGPGQRSPYEGEKNNFLPRIGIAYQLRPRTTIRAGYGMFYDSIGVNTIRAIQTGFSMTTTIHASRDSGLTYVATNANPFPNGLDEPPGPSAGLRTNLGKATEFYNRNLKHPYSQRWSLGLQQMLPGQFLAEASYVGNRGTRLKTVRQYSALPNEYLSTSPFRDQARHDYLGANFPNPFRGTDPNYVGDMTRGRMLTRFPAFSSVSAEDPVGYSWYHSLQARSERRFSNGFTFQLAYTWSKLMEAMDWLNPGDPMPYEQIANFDRTHRLVMSGIWELPFGRNRAIGSTMPSVLNFFAGGWQIGSTVTRQSGGALNWGNVLFIGDIKNIPLPKSERDAQQWFNINAGFNRNSGQQLTTSNLRTFPMRFSGIRADGRATWDFSAIKNFPIHETLRLQFRAECYNAWNHPNFEGPNTNPTSTSFGRINNLTTDPRNFQFSLRLRF